MVKRGQGRGSGRGQGRPRGSTNKPKTTLWEYEIYKPEPDIYNALWHIRKAPPTITQNLSNECPISNATSRIVARRQSEDGRCRNFYIVKIRYLDRVHTDAVAFGDSCMHGTGKRGGDQNGNWDNEETAEVDMSVILRYVSQRELERFENAEFRAEAEAEAVLRRAEAEELATHRLEKNARAPGVGGTWAGLHFGQPSRGSGRPRSRGRGRGRGRGRERGGYALATNPEYHMLTDAELDVEDEIDALDIATSADLVTEETVQRAISSEDPEEFEEDDEEGGGKNIISDLMRTAFVANSALSSSPKALHRRLSGVPRGHPEVPDINDSDDQSISSAAAQFGSKRRTRERSRSEDDKQESRHRSKRPRSESANSSRRYPGSRKPTFVPNQHQHPLSRDKSPPQQASESEEDSDDISNHITNEPMEVPNGENVEESESDHNEYVVESILDHSYREGAKYYLVKWDGYEDATDWLEEQDLENVQDLVSEYEEKIRRKGKGKGKEPLR